MIQTNNNIAIIEESIHRYLLENPNAAETLEGIARWWLSRNRIDDSINEVEQALNRLVNKGIMMKRLVGNNKTIYKATNTGM